MKRGKKEDVLGLNGCMYGCQAKSSLKMLFLQDVQCDTPRRFAAPLSESGWRGGGLRSGSPSPLEEGCLGAAGCVAPNTGHQKMSPKITEKAAITKKNIIFALWHIVPQWAQCAGKEHYNHIKYLIMNKKNLFLIALAAVVLLAMSLSLIHI